ncbi:MAG: histidinol dehydrogenase [Candidatus Izemoplasmataceae bacterium]
MIPILKTEDKKSLSQLLSRTQFDFSDVNETVETIVNEVKTKGDSALMRYTRQFDSDKVEAFKVDEATIDEAFNRIDDTLKEDLKKAAENIRAFHQSQLPLSRTVKDENGIVLKELIRPIETVGIYIPGGTAAYPSTVLMNAIPAAIAGVKRIVMITPPQADGSIKDSLLVAAKISGVDEIYKVGGAQSIAALTYGTQTLPKVDKIVGPGNIYVAMAKRMVSGHVGIDMVAGPSEILILADETTNPSFAAADMLSQAEHDPYASAIVLTTSKTMAEKIKDEALAQAKTLTRRTIIEASLQSNGAIIVCEGADEMLDLANAFAPEHLEILLDNPDSYVERIKNAGAVFVGPYTPEPVGDYFAGPNHTLPTSGSARFSSALSSRDFIKVTTVTQYSRKALKEAGASIMNLADEEGLTAHKEAVRRRMEES